MPKKRDGTDSDCFVDLICENDPIFADEVGEEESRGYHCPRCGAQADNPNKICCGTKVAPTAI